MRSTYTCTTLLISSEAWDEVQRAIRAAESPGNNYNHMFMDDNSIDMTHVALVRGRPSGTGMIAAERLRQVTVEGWTPEYDDHHRRGELAKAAVCYLIYGKDEIVGCTNGVGTPYSWPWKPEWWKPSSFIIRNLVKAGALIAAQIDQLLRQGGTDGRV